MAVEGDFRIYYIIMRGYGHNKNLLDKDLNYGPCFILII